VPAQEGVSPDFAIRVDGWNLGPASTLDGNGNVPVVRNENALAIGAGGAMFESCG
jgi:mannosylglycoprotein endo-beta-mannosidase